MVFPSPILARNIFGSNGILVFCFTGLFFFGLCRMAQSTRSCTGRGTKAVGFGAYVEAHTKQVPSEDWFALAPPRLPLRFMPTAELAKVRRACLMPRKEHLIWLARLVDSSASPEATSLASPRAARQGLTCLLNGYGLSMRVSNNEQLSYRSRYISCSLKTYRHRGTHIAMLVECVFHIARPR
jgi:hypothetical protein